MKTMRERAATLGGSLKVISAPGKGTTIEVMIPNSENK
jgi:signal transduction histidine kinase